MKHTKEKASSKMFIVSSGKLREADCIAEVFKPYHDKAILLAAAPELLEALKEMSNFHQYDIEDEHLEGRRKAYIKAIQAIQKAEGEL